MKHLHETSPDPLAALRHATGARHQRLDGGLPLSGDAPSLSDYADHLRLLRAWLAPLDAWLDGYHDGPQGHAALPGTDRLALIEADLQDACMDRGQRAARAPGDGGGGAGAGWPQGASAAYRWGVCYVIEGSQLGGMVLYQRLAARFAPHPLRYLRGNETGPGPRWRAFMQALRAQVRTPDEIAEACTGACAAFDSILALGFCHLDNWA